MLKNCIICGAEFDARRNTLTCSAGCRLARKRVNNRAYRQRPEGRQRNRESQRAYRQRPEGRQRNRELQRAYYQRPEVRQRHAESSRAYYQRPEVRQRNNERQRTIYRDQIRLTRTLQLLEVAAVIQRTNTEG